MSAFSYIAAALIAAALAAGAHAQEAPIVVGAVVSQTGSQAGLADGYGKGLRVWEEQTNAAGGLLGRRVELRILDDHSEATRAGPAYAELIASGADLLVGPYGSAATLVAAAEAERARHVMANGAGPSERVYKRPQRWLFQTVAPYSSYGEGVLALAARMQCASVLIVARSDVASAEMAQAAHARAEKMGLYLPEVVSFSGREDLVPLVARAAAQYVDCWISFGEVRDAADTVIEMKRVGYAPRLFHASSAAQPGFVRRVGQDAEHTLASLAYDPAWPTAYNAAFAAAYAARWGRPPDAAAAQGHAAATVLARAVERVGSLDQEKLRAALADMEIETVLGTYRVGKSGEQTGIKPAVVQIQRGRRVLVWPPALAGEAPLEPYLPWDERTLLR
ncbi:MAG TPA: ABC transporter substrate-binding protein [Burkholderiales bacterium]